MYPFLILLALALGLSGGLVPSVSALLVLLGSISIGRPVYGIVLTVAFGIWAGLAWGFRKASFTQDRDGSPRWTGMSRKLAAAGVTHTITTVRRRGFAWLAWSK
jgi:ABC-type nickel/cobalt efflux system permease component RcnA